MKLTIELVPSSSWYDNVRSLVKKSQWDLIRRDVYAKASHVCEICGGKGSRHPVECHEIWEYDDNTLTQKLVGMIALCPMCHKTKHLGFAFIKGYADVVLDHCKKVNNISDLELEEYVKHVFSVHAQRSKKQWAVDISYLKTTYGIDIK